MHYIYTGMFEGIHNLVQSIGNFDWELLFVWSLLMAIDIVTGYISACKRGCVSSRFMRTGLYRKMLDTMAILAILLMQSVVYYLGIGAPIGPVLIGAFCLKELTSILENTGTKALPKVVQKWLQGIKNTGLFN